MSQRFRLNSGHLALYPSHCVCEASMAGKTWSCQLIALYRGGARLRAPSFRAMALVADQTLPGRAVALNIRLVDRDVESGGFPGVISSVNGDEILVAFAAPLTVAFSRIVEANPRHFPG